MAWAVDYWRPIRVVLGRACRGLAGGFLAPDFRVGISVNPRVSFILEMVLISMCLG